ncbi:MAG: hypothetical protein ACI4PF_03500 [Christensenellales bacterium]
MNYSFDLKNKNSIDNIRSSKIYQFNLARNMALLSNDPAIIRYFYQIEAPKLIPDQWLVLEVKDKFMAQYIEGQAFAYFGICPMIVQAKVNLLASNGFKCQSDNKKVDNVLNKFIEESKLESKFAEGVYLESGLGDFLYRLTYNPKVSDKPILDVIEPQYFEINYVDKAVKSYVLKLPAEDNQDYELREIHYKNEKGQVCISYRFFFDGKYVDPENKSLVEECKLHFKKDIDLRDKILPFKDFMIEYKQNANSNQLYKGERGVPDIQGLDSIEDALTESISDLIDAIRKGGIKTYIDEDLIPQDAEGNKLKFNPFNKQIITTKGSSNPANPESLFRVEQGEIYWESYIKTIQNLMSIAINKAGLSPTTIGLTGLESINSSAESQEAREKTSLRTRELCLSSWEITLKNLLNKYLQMLDYIEGEEILDYSEIIKIHFNDYISPSVENVTEVLVNQVMAGIKSKKRAIQDLNEEFDEKDAENELINIFAEQGKPVLQDGFMPAKDMENNTPSDTMVLQ